MSCVKVTYRRSLTVQAKTDDSRAPVTKVKRACSFLFFFVGHKSHVSNVGKDVFFFSENFWPQMRKRA